MSKEFKFRGISTDCITRSQMEEHLKVMVLPETMKTTSPNENCGYVELYLNVELSTDFLPLKQMLGDKSVIMVLEFKLESRQVHEKPANVFSYDIKKEAIKKVWEAYEEYLRHYKENGLCNVGAIYQELQK